MLLSPIGTLIEIHPTLTLGVKGEGYHELIALFVTFLNRGLSYENDEKNEKLQDIDQ